MSGVTNVFKSNVIMLMVLTFLDQTIFGGGFPLARHSNFMAALFGTSKRVGGATKSMRGGTIWGMRRGKISRINI